MSYRIFFDLSSGLANPLKVPKGTLKSIMKHVAHIESVFGLETERYKNNPPHWRNHWRNSKLTTEISDETYCIEAEKHNRWVRWLFAKFGEWSEKPVAKGETITPKAAMKFWQALTMIDVPPERWTSDYYRARMETLYAVMRGLETEGISFDVKPLTPKQAGAVIRLFEEYLDPGDIRLEVPKGHDRLFSTDEYAWCDKCGAIAWDDIDQEIRRCRKHGGCPLRRDYPPEKG